MLMRFLFKNLKKIIGLALAFNAVASIAPTTLNLACVRAEASDYTLDDLWDDFVEDIEDDYEDDLSDEEIDELIASYEKETESLRKDTHQRLEHIRKMIIQLNLIMAKP